MERVGNAQSMQRQQVHTSLMQALVSFCVDLLRAELLKILVGVLAAISHLEYGRELGDVLRLCLTPLPVVSIAADGSSDWTLQRSVHLTSHEPSSEVKTEFEP